MNTKIALLILSITLLAACIVAGGLLLYREHEERQPPAIIQETPSAIDIIAEITPTPSSSLPVSTPAQMNNPATAATPAPTSASPTAGSTPKPASTMKPAVGDLGTVSIAGKTFAVKRGVDEKTLKSNIGWMESSALPGQEGVCILMGHRNTQFRVLKDVKAGDQIVFTKANGEMCAYTILSAVIVANDEALRFEAEEGKTLVLVTCYPFYYEGHAPQKFVVRARGGG